jgi:MerR family transcriptional regulator/heat shock protein HspR
MGHNLEKGNSQQPNYQLEVVDLADEPALLSSRGKSSRPPAADPLTEETAENQAATLAEETISPPPTPPKLESVRINGRPTRASKASKAKPGRVNQEKPIYAPSVAADILGLHPRTLRIYEEHGLVVPFRTPTQRRRYSQADIKKTRFIQYLTQNRRVNLEGVKIIFFMLEELRSLGIPQPIQHVFNDYRESD